MTPDEKLIDEVISDTLDLFRLAAAKRRAIIRRLNALQKELVEKLATEELSRRNKAKLATFLRSSAKIINEHYRQAQLEFDFGGIGKTVAQMTANSLHVVLGKDALTLPIDDYFRALASNAIIDGHPASAWWAAQEVSTTRAFEGAVRQGLASAETNAQIIARIVGQPRKGVPGIMDIERRKAAALVQTSVQAVANTARLETFKANDDVIAAIKQVSTLDSHTSKTCIAYSGAMWKLDGTPLKVKGKLSPAFNGGCPRHFNCRSVIVPVTKTLKELGIDLPEMPTGTRASDEGQIDAKTSFDAFLKRKGQAYQDKALGVGRADLWRAGKITLRDLVSGDGRELTLDELRQKAGIA